MTIFIKASALAAVVTAGTATAEPFKMPSFVSAGPIAEAQWYDEIARSIMDGTQITLLGKFADDVVVITTGGDDRAIADSGRSGGSEVIHQISNALDKLGKPASYSCKPETRVTVNCSFDFAEPGKSLSLSLVKASGPVRAVRINISTPGSRPVIATPAPVAVPPALAAIDRPVVDAFVKHLAAGKISSAAQMVRPEAMVARAVRNPFKDETVTKSQGKGPAAAEAEAKLIVSELGQPKSVECEYQTSYAICAFKFAPGTGMWIVGLSTQDGQIGHVHYIYATRQMILDMQRAAM